MSILTDYPCYAQNMGVVFWAGCGMLVFAGVLLLRPRPRIDAELVAWLVTGAWMLVLYRTVQVIIDYPFSVCGHTVYFSDLAYEACIWFLYCIGPPVLLSVPVAVLAVSKRTLGAFRAHRWSYVALLVVLLDLVTFLALLNYATGTAPPIRI